jgi:hypothetical protein
MCRLLGLLVSVAVVAVLFAVASRTRDSKLARPVTGYTGALETSFSQNCPGIIVGHRSRGEWDIGLRGGCSGRHD